jgi:ribosomal subunit interface protein
MKINLKGTGMEITPEISDYLEKRLMGIEKFLPASDDAFTLRVELGKTSNHHHSGEIFRAEINIYVGGKSFRAVSEKIDLNSAIDDVRDEISRELSSHKEKRISLVRRGGQKLKSMLRKFYQ